VQTTLDLDLQQTANNAVEDGLTTYERHKGWVGKLENVASQETDLKEYRHPDWAVKVRPGDYVHALVTSALPMEIHARAGNEDIVLLPEDWKWTGKSSASGLVKPGDIIYVHLGEAMEGRMHRATLEQDSGAEGALMAIDNTTGDVLAMVGGRDYALSQFNRATEAERQTGSSFKPYVYTAAIEDGVKPDDIIVDAPVSFGGYTPHNYENDYKGAMTIENAFAESRNIPALKLAARVGIHKVIDVAHRFGVTSNIPAYLPVALGAVEITLNEQVASYSVFPNDGIRATPRLITKVSNADGITLWEDTPAVNEVIDSGTARTMMTLLRAVTAHGTGAAVAQLNHPLGGKTGTTSDFTDAWFLGFSPSVTCGVWVGYDSRQSLGEKETGAKAALPIWMTFMRAAIAGKDSEQFLMDSQEDNRLQAGVVAPVKPDAAEIASAPTPAAIARPVRTDVGTRPVAPARLTAPRGKSVVRTGVMAPILPVAGTTPSKSLVKPALSLQSAPTRAGVRIKPAAYPPGN
jgi:penicillin-binding protein 1A